jgi:mercuric ion binding protein
MKRQLLAAAAILSVLTTSAWAASKTVTLSVPGMDCPVCPITVKKALTKAEVNFDKRQAVVTFDDTMTNIETLTKASANAGYPATVKQ